MALSELTLRQGETITDLRGADLEGILFRGCTFPETDLRNAKVIDCEFENCDLSSIAIDNATLRVRFRGSRIQGVNFFTARRAMLSLGFDECLLRYSSFADLKLKGLKLTRSTLSHVDFADSDLSEADLSGSKLEECVFQNTNLTKADFRGATGYAIDPRNNRLQKAKFDVPEVLSLLAPFGIELD